MIIQYHDRTGLEGFQMLLQYCDHSLADRLW